MALSLTVGVLLSEHFLQLQGNPLEFCCFDCRNRGSRLTAFGRFRENASTLRFRSDLFAVFYSNYSVDPHKVLKFVPWIHLNRNADVISNWKCFCQETKKTGTPSVKVTEVPKISRGNCASQVHLRVAGCCRHL